MKNQQAGGVVSFIIVAVALTGLLLGGLYLSKSQGRADRNSDTSTPQVAAPSQEEQKSENGGEQQQNNETRQNQEQPASGSTTNPGDQNSGTSPQTNGSQSTTQDRVATTGPSDEIPETGPGETAATIIALSILTFAGYRFVSTRRLRRNSALSR